MVPTATATVRVALQAALRELLAQPVVDECATDQLHRIKFLSLKNLADLLARQPGSVHDALLVYCQATEVVGDDVVLWNKLATLVRLATAGAWPACWSWLAQPRGPFVVPEQ